MPGIIEGLRNAVATMGVVDALLYAMSRAATAMSGGRMSIVKYYFVSQPVQAASGTAGVRTGAFTLDWADADSSLFAQVARPPQVIARRFEQGARCLAATIGEGRLAGFLWFVVGPYDEDEVRARFVAGPEGHVAWDFDVTIMPPYRMGRLFGYLWQRAAIELAARGVRRTVSRISAFNPMSMSAHRRLGATIIGQAIFLRIGPWQLMRASSSPRWHFSSRGGRPSDTSSGGVIEFSVGCTVILRRWWRLLRVMHASISCAGAIAGTFDQASCEHRRSLELDIEQEVLKILDAVLSLNGRGLRMTAQSQLLGAIPELDSMAVLSLLTALEERFGITVEDDEIDGSTFATVGSLTAFVKSKVDS